MKNYIYIFLISMVPVIELRGAIPAGFALGLPWYTVLPICIVANLVPVPFIIFLIKKILNWMHGTKHLHGIADWLFKKAEKNRGKIEKYATWGLFLFVAIPLPGTGAWTGALVASLIDMPKKKAFLSIAAGVTTAGIIITLILQLGIKALEWLI